MRRLLVVLLGVLLVAGCTSSGGDSAPTPTPSKSAEEFASPQAVLDALAAGGMYCQAEARPFPAIDPAYMESALVCRVKSVEAGDGHGPDFEGIAVVWFATAAQREEFQRTGLQAADAYAHYVLGPTWAVATGTKDTARDAAEIIGGTVD